jgi:hypothetical protein
VDKSGAQQEIEEEVAACGSFPERARILPTGDKAEIRGLIVGSL